MAFVITGMVEINYEEQISTFDRITSDNFRLAAEEETRNYLIEQNLVIEAPYFELL